MDYIEAFFIRLWHALSDPAVPAWVQAVGSLVAIGVVFWIERLERRRETARLRHEAESRAEHLAVALSAYMTEFHQRVQQANRKLTSLKADQRPDLMLLGDLAIQIPNVVEDSWDRLGELGPVLGAAIVELLVIAKQYERGIADQRQRLSKGEWVETRTNLSRMETLLDQTIIPGLAKVRDRFIKRSSAQGDREHH